MTLAQMVEGAWQSVGWHGSLLTPSIFLALLPTEGAAMSRSLFGSASGAPVWDTLILLCLVVLGCVGAARGILQRKQVDVVQLRFVHQELIALLSAAFGVGLVLAVAATHGDDSS
jgi:hypothetical protein